MTIFTHSFRTCLRGLWIPLVGALLLCLAGLQLAPQMAGTGADRSAGQWLHLPGLLLVAAVLGAALESWPLLSRARPGFDWVLRIENRPLHGCAAAAAGSLAALAAVLVLGGLGFQGLLLSLRFDQGTVRSRVPVTLEQNQPYLDQQRRRLVFRVDSDAPIHTVRLRPTAVLAGVELHQARVQVFADDTALHPAALENAGETIELRLQPPRPVARLRVERQPGPGLVLRLRPDRVEVVAAAARSPWVNSVLALLSYLGAAILALAVMILGHTHLALPVNFAAGLVTALLATLLGLTPSAAAISAFARGQWLLGTVPDAPGHRLLADLGIGIALLAGTWVLHRVGRGYAGRGPASAGGAGPT